VRFPRQIDAAPLLAALGGLTLFVSLFLHWYQPGLSAWRVFEVLDLILAALAVGVVGLVLANLLWDAELRESTLPLLGLGAFVVVVSQLLNHPPAAQGAPAQTGAWLGLAGSALMAAGGILSAARLSLVITLSSRAAEGAAAGRAAAPASRGPSPSTEAAAVEPEVQDELYPEQQRSGPIGADDPEPWTASPEDETLTFDPEGEERT
jgi:hypothetical protein